MNGINWVSILCVCDQGDLSYSPVSEERYKPFVLKCPWLGMIKSCNSLAVCKLFKLFGLV